MTDESKCSSYTKSGGVTCTELQDNVIASLMCGNLISLLKTCTELQDNVIASLMYGNLISLLKT